jgi:hypothetical protein
MATLDLPTFSDVDSWSYPVPLDGTTYTLRCAFNERDGRWYAGLWDEDNEVPILAGVALAPDFPLFATKLPGYIRVYAPEGLRGEQADMDRMRLQYVDAESRAAGAGATDG